LLPDDDHLPAALNAIRDALEEHGDSFVVTASSGVVHLPAEATDPTDALRIASAPALAPIARFVRATHERYDGTGYPDQLARGDIPLISRIVFVCDSWDSMTTGWRPYRTQLTHQQAQAELRSNSGTQFDPSIVDAAEIVIDHQQQHHPHPAI
jgi:hypothetical protein